MTALHDKARTLLALRDKATPGPWHANGIAIEGAMDISEWETPTFSRYENTEFASAAHDMADLIRDQDAKIAALLAENERLTEESAWLARGNESLRNRVGDAESRYAALCEAEPVALLCVDGDHRCLMCDDDSALNALPHGTSLIPLPSMERHNG